MTKHFPLKDNIGFVDLIDRMQQDSALKVVNSARISYAKEKKEFGDEDKKLIHYLWEHEHTSPFRHSYFTFHIKMPLSVARQWVKYQVGSTWRKFEVDGDPVSFKVFDLLFDEDKGCSWNEVSGRYSVFKPEFYIPLRIRSNLKHGSKQASSELPDDFNHSAIRIRMMEHCEEAYKTYNELIESGVAKEMARGILPQNIYTEVYWTVSLQSLMHFLHQRLANDAQWEIRQYANAVYDLLADDMRKLGIYKEDLIA